MLLNIQYLRGLAAMMVVFHHSQLLLARHGSGQMHLNTPIGQAGVDIFFVISGFIMVYVTHGRNRGPVAFWRDRIIRIVPIYWVYTALMAIIALALPTLLNTAVFDLVHVIKSFLFIPAWHPRIETQAWPLLVQGWTLNYEMFFYLIFGALLILPGNTRRTVLLAVILAGLVILGQMLTPSGPVLMAYTSPLLLEFLAGALIAMAYIRGQLEGRALGWICLTLGLAGLILATTFPGWIGHRALEWGGPGALIVIAALALEPKAPRLTWLRILGDASYSTYLNHTFTLGVFGVIWKMLDPGTMAADLALLTAALVMAALVGVISYYVLERPLTGWLRRTPRARATIG